MRHVLVELGHLPKATDQLWGPGHIASPSGSEPLCPRGDLLQASLRAAVETEPGKPAGHSARSLAPSTALSPRSPQPRSARRLAKWY